MEAAPNVVGAVLPPQRQGHIEQPVLERRRLVPEIAHISDLVRFGEALSTGRHATIIAAGFFRDQMPVVQESFCTKILAFVIDPVSRDSALCNLRRGDRQAIWGTVCTITDCIARSGGGIPL